MRKRSVRSIKRGRICGFVTLPSAHGKRTGRQGESKSIVPDRAQSYLEFRLLLRSHEPKLSRQGRKGRQGKSNQSLPLAAFASLARTPLRWETPSPRATRSRES